METEAATHENKEKEKVQGGTQGDTQDGKLGKEGKEEKEEKKEDGGSVQTSDKNLNASEESGDKTEEALHDDMLSELPKSRRRSTIGIFEKMVAENSEKSVATGQQTEKRQTMSQLKNSNSTLSGESATSATASVRDDYRQRRKSTWVPRKTATFGVASEEDEVYYENIETGETQWDRPASYMSEEEEIEEDIRERMKFDPNSTLEEAYLTIDIIGSEATKERNRFVAGVKSAQRPAEERLEQLLLLIEHVGSEEEWDLLLTQFDYREPRTVFQYWGEKTTLRARLHVAKLFVVFGKLRPEIFGYFVGRQWGPDDRCFARNIELGVKEALNSRDKTQAAEALGTWMTLVHGVYSARLEEGVPDSAIPSYEFVELLFDVMASQPEEVFLGAAAALVALNWHLTKPDGTDLNPEKRPNHITQVAVQRRENSQYFCEALLHLLNMQHYPYSDGPFLGQLLRMLRTLLTNPTTATFFLTNDLKVLVDICNMAIADLPVKDPWRSGYLRVLQGIVQKPEYKDPLKLYKSAECIRVLQDCIVAKDDGMMEDAVTIAEEVLNDIRDASG